MADARKLADPSGTEGLRVTLPEDVPKLNDWVHDGHLEDAMRFSAEAARAVIPFAQESGWGHLHPSMPDPQLVRKTVFARHYQVPLTRCYLLVQHAQSLDADDIDWGNPTLLGAKFDESSSVVKLEMVPPAGVSIAVRDVDVRVLVSPEPVGLIHRRVLRGWPIEIDRSLKHQPG
jgi:hypothetical protein